jgi:hypothetical protein
MEVECEVSQKKKSWAEYEGGIDVIEGEGWISAYMYRKDEEQEMQE